MGEIPSKFKQAFDAAHRISIKFRRAICTAHKISQREGLSAYQI
ncbi:hypothetical protein [uncultured Campylobacter sp.]|nr:hypothetical protein [uncultured Campylobacter sp.]